MPAQKAGCACAMQHHLDPVAAVSQSKPLRSAPHCAETITHSRLLARIGTETYCTTRHVKIKEGEAKAGLVSDTVRRITSWHAKHVSSPLKMALMDEVGERKPTTAAASSLGNARWSASLRPSYCTPVDAEAAKRDQLPSPQVQGSSLAVVSLRMQRGHTRCRDIASSCRSQEGILQNLTRSRSHKSFRRRNSKCL